MRVIYVAGKFTAPNAWGVHRNVRRAEAVAYAIAEAGAMPLCPHTNTQHFFGTLTEEFWYKGTLELLRRCDAVMLVAEWEDSKGVKAELEEARARNMPIFACIDQLMDWLKTNP